MKTLNKEAFLEIADDFETIHNDLNLTVDNLDFGKSDIKTHPCNTVACHGGWGLALYGSKEEMEICDFRRGADLIAKKLGFNKRWELEWWASNNPEYWGNENGELMFSGDGYDAFGFDRPGQCTLLDIANHYRKVYARLPEGDVIIGE